MGELNFFKKVRFGQESTVSTSAKSNKNLSRNVMVLAWQFVKRNGYTLSEALRCAWRNVKLQVAMTNKIVKFYFQKVDGSIREAYGTLKSSLVPKTQSCDRKQNDTIQTYFDTEKQEWRCYKKANLVSINYVS